MKNLFKSVKAKVKNNNFYHMLYMQAEKTLEGIEFLNKYMTTGDEAYGDILVEKEREADELRRVLVSSLEQTFITPFEREDIYSLSRVIDDVIDYGCSTVEEMRLFGLKRNDVLVEMAGILMESSRAISLSVKYLENHSDISTEELVKVKHFENKMELVYRNAVVELLENDDFKYIFKMREIYRHLSNAADKSDEAANLLGHIIMKMT